MADYRPAVGDVVKLTSWHDDDTMTVIEADNDSAQFKVLPSDTVWNDFHHFVRNVDVNQTVMVHAPGWMKMGEAPADFLYHVKLARYNTLRKAARTLRDTQMELIGEALRLQEQGVKVPIAMPL